MACGQVENTLNDSDSSVLIDSINIPNKQKKYPDSTEFWINETYIGCIQSGKAVCECLSENQFIMLYMDKKNCKILIQSSVYFFGLETSAELTMVRAGEDSSKYVVQKIWPLVDSLVIELTSDRLYLLYGNHRFEFTNRWLRTLDIPTSPKGIFTYSSEIWTQRNTLNAKSLLAFPVTEGNSLFSFDELKSFIEKDEVSITCSDDYHYNSMLIKQADSVRYFHLDYDNDKVTIFEEKPGGRNRFEEIDRNGLKKQVFYKKKRDLK